MLAYRLVEELSRRWRDSDFTVQAGRDQLAILCVTEVGVGGVPGCQGTPQPRPEIARLIELARVPLPKAFRGNGVNAATMKKLFSNPMRR